MSYEVISSKTDTWYIQMLEYVDFFLGKLSSIFLHFFSLQSDKFSQQTEWIEIMKQSNNTTKIYYNVMLIYFVPCFPKWFNKVKKCAMWESRHCNSNLHFGLPYKKKKALFPNEWRKKPGDQKFLKQI